MKRHLIWSAASIVIAAAVAVHAQAPKPYSPPRTENKQPDFQGLWATEFLTLLERPPDVQSLTLPPDQARTFAAAFLAKRPPLTDPDTQILGIDQLALVKGEYRTSLVVEPDGKMPLTEAGSTLLTNVQTRERQKFDNPEERPLAERCLENLTYAPIRTVPVLLVRQIVQTRDFVVISAEDVPGPRIISLGSAAAPDWLRSIGGTSVGRWEGDALVVTTTNLRADVLSRSAAGRPILIGPKTVITERFTRLSDTELFYKFTVEDAELYTHPWSGEFSMTRYDGPILEYACHEANDSLTNMLKGGRAQDAAPAK